MSPDETCSKCWPSETARRWPAEEKSLRATLRKIHLLPWTQVTYPWSCFLGLNRACYKLQQVDFWHHRLLRHSGQRPAGNKQMYGNSNITVLYSWNFKSTWSFLLKFTWRLKLSLSSAKANIRTSKRLKWEGYWTLSSAQTGWKITWYGSTGFTQLEGKTKY